ncbi:MAG: UDP-N-acetylmuramate dehydrogenase [Acidobacteria bacterium]|nr:UDP-N-acetylmuramate dehydrogenase [Acidobacteriota bacterium]
MSGCGPARGAARAVEILVARGVGRVERGGRIAPWTSYQIGGPADVLVETESESDLEGVAEAARESGLDVLVLGRGSNVLVSDGGFRGIALRLGAGFRWSRRDGGALEAGAAAPLPALSGLALDEGLAGLEFAVSIPGSLGGAVRMNAGAHGRCMADVVEWAEVYSFDQAETVRFARDELAFDYRTARFPARSAVTAARLALEPGERGAIAERMREAREWRRRTQPLNSPNAGSVFKNPPGEFAARLVETVCGKGMSRGGARVSEVHANFIVAGAGARSSDVHALIRRIQRMVRRATGIDLQLELKLVGEFKEEDDDQTPV